jgi:hypothetical protein
MRRDRLAGFMTVASDVSVLVAKSRDILNMSGEGRELSAGRT